MTEKRKIQDEIVSGVRSLFGSLVFSGAQKNTIIEMVFQNVRQDHDEQLAWEVRQRLMRVKAHG